MMYPAIIHSRDAAEDTLKMVQGFYSDRTPGKCSSVDNRHVKAVMHCYSYSVEHAEEYLKLGLMFGIGGVVTFKNAKKLKEVVDMLPLEHIMLETDCPYMAPDPFRGKRNHSGYLTYVAEKIAEIKGVDVRTASSEGFLTDITRCLPATVQTFHRASASCLRSRVPL